MSDATTPTGVDLKDSKALFCVSWQDGSASQIPYRDLRLACRCALCIEEMTGQPLLDPKTVPQDVGIKECKGVGNYGVQITWTDDHSTGIYTWDRLRKIGDTGGDGS